MKISYQKSVYAEEHLTEEIEPSELAVLFEEYSNSAIASKEDGASFNFVEFTSHDTKLEQDIVSIHGAILDFDGCDCPVTDVYDILKDHYFIAYNSFSNGIKGTGSRFRVVLPFAYPLEGYNATMLKFAYEQICSILQYQLINLDSGFDESKINPGSFFILPCLTEHRIWHVNDAPYLDPKALLNSPLSQQVLELRRKPASNPFRRPVRRSTEPLTKAQKDTMAVASLIKWQTNSPGNGNSHFYRYAMSLKAKGFDLAEIELLLGQNYNHFGNGKERRKEIKHILTTIRNTKL